ncbi:hypothetical protein OG426_55895 (plasmid) [Streptomyces canus]|uniref:hypothetical protein n=1 Tax=Streptomyces canus TaxID=58343 RepID=UPI002250150B|nr:hypothetical protein [Streptomyces canus]MCX4853781.1 hypothetical protein [Streptomyces canus]WSW41583.1 hypothetical protein OG426_55895 [Streptomyces canus]
MALAAAGTAVSVLSACTSSSAAHAGEGRPSGSSAAVGADTSKWPQAVADKGLVKGLALPLQQYMQTFQDSVVIERAARSLETECMARYGFTVNFPPPGVNPPPNADDSNMPRRYGISDRAAAAKYGYELPPDTAQHPAAPDLTPAAIAVLTGRKALNPRAEKAPSTYRDRRIPEGGCQQESYDKLGARIDFTLISRLDHDSLAKSQEDARVQKAVKAWSACMKNQGYTVADPYGAFDLVPRSDGGSVPQKEITLALADIDCKQKTDLVRIWYGVDAEIQRQQVEENQLALEQAREKNSKAVKAAEAALRD